MKVGLVGFAGSGKSAVFAALTGSPASAGKGGRGGIRVPDERVDGLAALCRPRKTTYAEILFEDYPAGCFGSGAGAISPVALGVMRTLDVLAEVVEGFSGQDTAELQRRIVDFHEEILLSDLAVVEKRLERLAREGGQTREEEVLQRCREALDQDRELCQLDLDEQERRLMSGFQFLTLKPRIIIVNVAEDDASGTPQALRSVLSRWGLDGLSLSAALEYELVRLDAEERSMFLAGYGLEEGARERFLHLCYGMLDLIVFLTAGQDEVRAWPIPRGTTAVAAAGKVHSDIARGFIRAEVIGYEDYLRYGGEAGCRREGKLKVHGKDYVIADGDIVHFRFNV